MEEIRERQLLGSDPKIGPGRRLKKSLSHRSGNSGRPGNGEQDETAGGVGEQRL